MFTRWRQLTILLPCFLLLGCQGITSLLDEAPRPTMRLRGASFRDLSLRQATLAFDLEIGNPYSVPLPLTNVSYSLATSGQPFMSGDADVQGMIPARGKKTVQVPVTVAYSQLLETVKDIRPGAVVPYVADLRLRVDPPREAMAVGAGQLELPVRHEGKLPVPAAPEVELTSVRWSRLDFDEAVADLELRILNKNQFPVDLRGLGYDLSLGDTPIGSSRVRGGKSFASGGQTTLKVPLSFAPKNLGTAAFRVLTGGSASYRLRGEMDLQTPYGGLSAPYERTGQTRLLKRD